MPKTETYSDNEGNTITIETAPDGVTVNARIRTKPKYTGGASAAAARDYANAHRLVRK